MHSPDASVRDYIQLHLVVLSWGLTAILGKLIELPPVDLTIWRTFLAAVGFVMLAVLLKVPLRLPKREALALLGVGALIGWHWTLFFLSARLSTASVTLAAMPTLMVFCSVIEPLVDGKRKWRVSELVAGFIICCAVWLIYQVEFRYWLGFSVALASVLFAAVFAVANKHLAVRYHFSVSMSWQMTGGLVACVLLRPIVSDDFAIAIPEGRDWLWLILLSMVCTVAAYAGYADLLRRMSVFTVNVAYNLEPVYGVILAAAVFGQSERMSPGFYAGASIILASVLALPFWNRSHARN